MWITCPRCGWQAFVPKDDSGDLVCPSCGLTVTEDVLCDDANDRERDDKEDSQCCSATNAERT